MNPELTYIIQQLKLRLVNEPKFKAIKSKQAAADYLEANLNKLLSDMTARETELTAIFVSDTEHGEAMRDYLMQMTIDKANIHTNRSN